MESQKGISVIVPTYNEAATIKGLIKRLFLPKINKLEVIIVDASQSSDNISEKLKEFPINFISSNHTCRSIQLNEGARSAKYDILYFVHADAIPPTDYATKICESIENEYDYGYFRFEFDSNNIFLKLNSYLSQFKGFYTGGGDQSFYIKKSLFESISGYNEELQLCEDFDLSDRLKKLKYKYEIINSKLMISSRKYDKANYFKVNLINFYILRQFRKGVPTEILRNKYRQLLR